MAFAQYASSQNPHNPARMAPPTLQLHPHAVTRSGVDCSIAHVTLPRLVRGMEALVHRGGTETVTK